MTPQQTILILSSEYARVLLERDVARTEVERLKAKVAELTPKDEDDEPTKPARRGTRS